MSIQTQTNESLPHSSHSLGEASVEDFITLLKPRVMSLVVFTGIIGYLLAPVQPHPILGFIAILCIAVGSGAAGAINMWYDRDIDRLMERTKNRPLPQNRVSESAALGFGVVLSFGSVLMLGLSTNWLAAGLLLSAICFYVFIYTMLLKRRTSQNIVIGGAAGAFPPLIGWVAACGTVDLFPITLFLIIFLWTPPHFWALALHKSDEYAKAGVPMLPVTNGIDETKKQIFIYSVLLVASTFIPFFAGWSGLTYFIGAVVLGVLFLMSAFRLFFPSEKKIGLLLFGYSIIYLFALFGLLIID